MCPQPDRYGGAYVGLAAAISSFGGLAAGPVGGKVGLNLRCFFANSEPQLVSNSIRHNPTDIFRNLTLFQGSAFAAAAIVYTIARFLVAKRTLIV
jgi:hypothetical protein